MSAFDGYVVVNAAAGVWRCVACGDHVASPAVAMRRSVIGGGLVEVEFPVEAQRGVVRRPVVNRTRRPAGMRRQSGKDQHGRPLPRCKGCGNVSILDGGKRRDYLNAAGYHTACKP